MKERKAMNKLFEELQTIVSLDPGKRGLLENIPPSDLSKAAQLMKDANRVIIVTGFPITGMDIGETDGPIGAVSLAAALQKVGKQVYIATDPLSDALVGACCDCLSLRSQFPPVLVASIALTEGKEGCDALLDLAKPDLIIAIERPGKGKDGHFHNMRGQFIDHMTADTDSLLEAGIPVIAIGDGGNELGMGNYFDIIGRFVNHGELIAAEKTCTVPLAAGISNFWGWGLSAVLSAVYKKDLMTSAFEEETLLEACVKAGGVDGVLKEAILSVDGLAGGGIREVHAPIRAAMETYLKGN